MQTQQQSGEQLWALVPVKSLTRCKQRLNSCLGSDRPGLAVAMFTDVMNALAGSREVNHIAVVTADSRVSHIAGNISALVVDEVEPMGMNEALNLGIEEIIRTGGRKILIVPADIPLVTSSVLDRLVHDLQVQRRSSGNDVIGIGPSKDRGGTNFLYFETSHRLPLMYGPDSYMRHTKSAIEQEYKPVPLHSPGISLDIDEEKDLREFISFCLASPEYQTTATWQFLQGHGYINRADLAGTANANEQSNSLSN